MLQQDLDRYEKIKALNSPGAHAIRLLQLLRKHLDASDSHAERIIRACGDGDYSNLTLLLQLPPRTVYIGRTRTDIKLRGVPKPTKRRLVGRPRSYGKQLPTPDELRKDKTIALGGRQFLAARLYPPPQREYQEIILALCHMNATNNIGGPHP